MSENPRPIVYLDKTYLHPGYKVKKCWQSERTTGVLTEVSEGQRWIIVNAGESQVKMSKLGALHATKYTGAKHTATVIFFHGSGGTGDNMKQWVDMLLKTFSFPHIKILFPTAPLQPYTASGGSMSNVWFDREDISPNVPERVDSLNKIEGEVKNLIKLENDAGISNNRIIVGGFSMGGALAFHTAYRWAKNVKCVFAFSSFLNENSLVFQDLKKTSESFPPLLQLHGDMDDLVFKEWGLNTYNQLTELGVKGEFHVLERLGHSLNKRGLIIIKEWIEKNLPDVKL